MYNKQLSHFNRQIVINHIVRLARQSSVINSLNGQEIHVRHGNLKFVDLNKVLGSRDEFPNSTATQLVAQGHLVVNWNGGGEEVSPFY